MLKDKSVFTDKAFVDIWPTNLAYRTKKKSKSIQKKRRRRKLTYLRFKKEEGNKISWKLLQTRLTITYRQQQQKCIKRVSWWSFMFFSFHYTFWQRVVNNFPDSMCMRVRVCFVWQSNHSISSQNYYWFRIREEKKIRNKKKIKLFQTIAICVLHEVHFVFCWKCICVRFIPSRLFV